ncbi:MAG: hypothetical protein HFG80_06090 [Eubacterium sp.]|nr:hypothetical protein [Eubacterium sp.]
MTIKTYSELSQLKSFEKRFRYLQLGGIVGRETFGSDRFINQEFYASREWKSIRDFVILRDNGCDLGVDGFDICGKIIIHHLNPILPKDIETNSDFLLNPEYLISTTHKTHNAIHYGDETLLAAAPVERAKNDTCPWRK